MRVFTTGSTGFIGAHVARKLRERGDEVRALVRSPGKAMALAELGCELIEGGLGADEAIVAGLEGCDAAIHGAAIYEVGIPSSRREAMYETNVAGTEAVLDAAREAGTPKVVYISTVGAFGNTHGKIVDETFEHPGEGFGSYYEETKYLAHQVAKRLIADGLPLTIVQPGGVYGPDDHSELGKLIKQMLRGRLPAIPFPDFGITMVHVEDVADGVLLALDKGEVGESYVLGGQNTTNRKMLEMAAKVAGKSAPKLTMPTTPLKVLKPFGGLIGPVIGYPPNLGELVSASDGMTMFASHQKAVEQLGYAPRDLEATIRDTLVAEGRLKG